MSLDQVIMLPGLSSGPRLLLSDASESFDFEANSHSFFVNSNLTWSWSSDVAWITSDEDTPQTGSQTFSYSVTENISTQRTGTITFTSGDITRTHTVTQGPYPILTIDDAAHTFDSDADSLTFNVTSNTDWTWFASEDWVTSSEAVFQNGNQAFTYSVTANTGAERTATITFVDVQAGVVTEVHSITQSAEATPLLLDTYTGAVGFSLRKIRTAYTGDCIRVRRASDDAEQDIGFSGNDLDTAAIETFCSGTTGFVTTWYDQVGSNNATQTTGSIQPIIYESGAVVINEHGLPAIRFLDEDASRRDSLLVPLIYPVTETYVANSFVYSLLVDGTAPTPVTGYFSGFGRGLASTHDAATRAVRAATVRAISGGNVVGSVIAINTTTVRFDRTDRTEANQTSTGLEIWIDLGVTADVIGGDRDADFQPIEGLILGNSGGASAQGDVLLSEAVVFTVDQDSNNLAIRTDQYNYWTDSVPTPPAPLTLSIDSASATFNQNAQSGSFEVTSNTDWTWTSSAAWLTSAETSPQNGNQTFSYSVSENTGSERVATITLSITGTSVIHTVTQDAAPVPPVDPDIEDFTEFDYVADMVASMDAAKGAGQVWYAQGYRYVELDSGATDQHLTTAGGVKLRALQDGSGAVTTEQLGWLPAVVQESAANAQIPKLDTDSVLTVTDFYDCDNYRVTFPSNVHIYGAIRKYSGFKAGTQSGTHRQRINSGGSVRRVKYLCDQLDGAAPCLRIDTTRFIADDVQMEHKTNSGFQLNYSDKTHVENCEFWDAHWNLYLVGGVRFRVLDSYFSADWTGLNFGEGIKTSGSESPTDSLKVTGCYFDRTRRDGIDLTGGGVAMRIVNNAFYLAGVGRNPENVGVPVQGIDIKVISGGVAVGEAEPIQNLDISDNVFRGAGVLTTQTDLDASSSELRWTRGLNGISYSRNTYSKENYFGVIRGFGPALEVFCSLSSERTFGVTMAVRKGAARNIIADKSIISPRNVAWIDFCNYFVLPNDGDVISRIDYVPNFVGPKITGHVTKMDGRYTWWTRLYQDFTYSHLSVSVSCYGPGDLLVAWSNGGTPLTSGGEGIRVSSCFGNGMADLMQHSTGDNGKINDVYILGNIVKATNLVNDPGTDIRTGLWIRQNTSDGANARTGAGTTSPVIEQNVGVS